MFSSKQHRAQAAEYQERGRKADAPNEISEFKNLRTDALQGGGYRSGKRKPWLKALLQPVILALNEELASGGDARKTFDILVERGLSKKSAFETMLRAKVFCLNEIDFGLPDRWLAVVASLAEGRAVDDLFPAGLYRRPDGAPS